MSFEHKIGDIFTTNTAAVAQGVNVKGLMGAGLARAVAHKHPEVLPPYMAACKDKSLAPGGFQAVLIDNSPENVNYDYIFNLASQNKPGADASMEWLEASLEEAIVFVKEQGLTSFALPRIGCGIGALKWPEVKALLEKVGEREDTLLIEIWSEPNADN